MASSVRFRVRAVVFERDMLFPAAGLKATGRPILAGAGARGPALVCRQRGGAPVLDKENRPAAAIEWLTRFVMMSPARAEQRTRFFDDYRSYVIN